MWPVNPLQRTCTELPSGEDKEAARSSPAPAPVITVRELAEVPVFVLLGEPGMGKSETMKALASLVLGEQGKPIAANDFIVLPASQHNAERPVFIDALDEARATGNTTVWRELRRTIAHSGLTRFGVACRVADWQSTDAQDLANVAQGQRIRVVALNPLTPEQRHAVLKSADIEDVEDFEKQAEALGFADMLGNPQSLKLLVASVKKNQGQWPETRRDAYELACQALVQESNQRHRQVQRLEVLMSDENLLDAAGWLCALMLLSNQNEVADEALGVDAQEGVRLSEVLDALPANGCSPDAIRQVLQHRLFIKPRGYTATHRTVAEYLAARYINKRVTHGGLLPQRVSALMVASGQHLVTNLRGLAGWLAVLSEPLRQLIFEVDPWAVLDYGDLNLLEPADMQALVEKLECVATTESSIARWQRARDHVPLVRPDMFAFVSDWLRRFDGQHDPASESHEVADVLLNALAQAPHSAAWTPVLSELVRNPSQIEGTRSSALDALYRHISSPGDLIPLLDEFHAARSSASNKRLIDSLLTHLYPDNLPPSKVMPYLDSSRREGNRMAVNWFWGHHIQKQTPDDRLIELMDAIATALHQPSTKELRRWKDVYQLDGLRTLLVRAILRWGTEVPTNKLSAWLIWCLNLEKGMLHLSEPSDRKQLEHWLGEHPSLVFSVLAHQVANGMSSWTAQRNLVVTSQPGCFDRFWLDQAVHWDSMGDAPKATDCLQTATWWVTQGNGGGVTLQDLEEATNESPTLHSALAPLLVSSLDPHNWQREHWLHNKEHAARTVERDAQNDKNLRYLLEHLEDVRTAKLLNYLGQAAMYEARQFGSDGKRLESWRAQHPALDEATRDGYRTLLLGLTADKAKQVVKAHGASQVLYIELPCLLAASELHREQPSRFFDLGAERLEAILTICLLNYGEPPTWFLDFAKTRPNELVATWLSLSKAIFRTEPIRLPQIGWLRSEASLKPIARVLLPELFSCWPSKFSETSFAEFAQLLEVSMREIHPSTLSLLISRRLRRKSLGSRQLAYLTMAGVWIDPDAFAPRLQQLLEKKQLLQTDLLGFVAHLTRQGGRASALPDWSPETIELLFLLLAPVCPAAYPSGAYWVGDKDHGRDFLFKLLIQLRGDPSMAAQDTLQRLQQENSLHEWHAELRASLSQQQKHQAESSFEVPTPRQVALTLQNKTPANPSDLMAVALDALGAVQQSLRNSDTNRVNRFWSVDSAGKRPQPPHRPEPECRNAIAEWLRADLAAMDISVAIENQHGAQNQSDIVLRVRTPAHEDMLLPIEIKGDWNRDLWCAATEQLARQYASEPRCHGQGLYLVLWLGENRGAAAKPKPHPNHPTHTPADLQMRLQQEANQKTSDQNIRVIVIDVSIPD